MGFTMHNTKVQTLAGKLILLIWLTHILKKDTHSMNVLCL